MRLPVAAWLIPAGAALVVSLLTALLFRWLAQRRNTPPRIFQRLPYPFSPAFIVFLIAFVFFGAARYQSTQPNLSDPGFIAWYNGFQGEAILEGVIVSLPDGRDTYTNLRVAVDKIRPASNSTLLFRAVHGLLLVQAAPGRTWRYGDRVYLEGRVEAPPENEGFSYRDYLARQGIYSYMRWTEPRLLGRDQGSPLLAVLYRFKDHALAAVYRIFPDPEASLLKEATQLHRCMRG